MLGVRRAFPWLLLLLQHSAWAVLRMSVPSSPIRASPFSSPRLPCNFSDPSRSINLGSLAVTWKRGTETIAQYVGGFQMLRPGPEMSEERLRVGDASLLLPPLQEVDAGLYTCLVIFAPDKDEGSFELKLEAEPHIALGPTKLQLAREGAVTCTVSGFYPGDVSVEWLKDGAVVKGPQTSVNRDSQSGLYQARSILELTPGVADVNAIFSCQVRHQSLEGPLKENFQLQLQAEPHVALGPTKLQLAREGAVMCTVSGFYPGDVSVEWLKDGAVVKGPQTLVHQDNQSGLYQARSILELTPGIADANANFSCQVRHQSLEDPLKENFQLQLQALPSLQVSTVVSNYTLEVLECLVSGFYPEDVQVHWLRNGVPQQQIESKPQMLPNGTFGMRSIILPKEMDLGVSYICQVQHKSWDNPLEMTAHWQPEVC